MHILSLLAPISLTIKFALLYLKKHIFRLKNYSYHIGSSYWDNETVYYIAYQPKHGVYTHTKKLKSSYSWFVSNEIIDLLVATFDKPDSAEAALESLKEKLKDVR